MLKNSLKEIKQKIQAAIPENHTEITIIAATKTQSREIIEKALSEGITDIGENYVKEAEVKLPGLKVRKHMIGHLQSNKAAKAVEIFDIIQTIDSIKLAKKISIAAVAQNKKIEGLIEVNISGEKNKHGIPENKVKELYNNIKALPNLKITGLMGMAPYLPPEETRPYFKKLNTIKKELGLKNLSCGMSGDYLIAIEEGANMIRIGTILFGSRN